MIERKSGKCVLLQVKKRSSEVLIPLIQAHVLPGSTIITDCWSSYNQLGNIDIYTHLRVNHSYNFLNPEDSEINTQKIENCWIHAKKIKESIWHTSESPGRIFD
jgi:transposase-like protein